MISTPVMGWLPTTTSRQANGRCPTSCATFRPAPAGLASNALQAHCRTADDEAMHGPDRIETYAVVRKGERTIQVRVIEYPARPATRPPTAAKR